MIAEEVNRIVIMTITFTELCSCEFGLFMGTAVIQRCDHSGDAKMATVMNNEGTEASTSVV